MEAARERVRAARENLEAARADAREAAVTASIWDMTPVPLTPTSAAMSAAQTELDAATRALARLEAAHAEAMASPRCQAARERVGVARENFETVCDRVHVAERAEAEVAVGLSRAEERGDEDEAARYRAAEEAATLQSFNMRWARGGAQTELDAATRALAYEEARVRAQVAQNAYLAVCEEAVAATEAARVATVAYQAATVNDTLRIAARVAREVRHMTRDARDQALTASNEAMTAFGAMERVEEEEESDSEAEDEAVRVEARERVRVARENLEAARRATETAMAEAAELLNEAMVADRLAAAAEAERVAAEDMSPVEAPSALDAALAAATREGAAHNAQAQAQDVLDAAIDALERIEVPIPMDEGAEEAAAPAPAPLSDLERRMSGLCNQCARGNAHVSLEINQLRMEPWCTLCEEEERRPTTRCFECDACEMPMCLEHLAPMPSESEAAAEAAEAVVAAEAAEAAAAEAGTRAVEAARVYLRAAQDELATAVAAADAAEAAGAAAMAAPQEVINSGGVPDEALMDAAEEAMRAEHAARDVQERAQTEVNAALALLAAANARAEAEDSASSSSSEDEDTATGWYLCFVRMVLVGLPASRHFIPAHTEAERASYARFPLEGTSSVLTAARTTFNMSRVRAHALDERSSAGSPAMGNVLVTPAFMRADLRVLQPVNSPAATPIFSVGQDHGGVMLVAYPTDATQPPVPMLPRHPPYHTSVVLAYTMGRNPPNDAVAIVAVRDGPDVDVVYRAHDVLAVAPMPPPSDLAVLASTDIGPEHISLVPRPSPPGAQPGAQSVTEGEVTHAPPVAAMRALVSAATDDTSAAVQAARDTVLASGAGWETIANRHAREAAEEAYRALERGVEYARGATRTETCSICQEECPGTDPDNFHVFACGHYVHKACVPDVLQERFVNAGYTAVNPDANEGGNIRVPIRCPTCRAGISGIWRDAQAALRAARRGAAR